MNETNHPSTPAMFRARYIEAVKECWNPGEARRRFPEYDQYHETWWREIVAWKFGDNPREFGSLTQLAYKIAWEINDGGKYLNCMDFNERKQRVYLGSGLIQYLGILCDEIELTRSLAFPASHSSMLHGGVID
jgi:hypothetical protein